MMGLQDLNVDTLLNAQIETYLKTEVTYAELRAKCLTLAPIQLIVEPIVHQLNDAATDDKINKTGLLTQEAHASQARQDNKEKTSDSKTQGRLEREKNTLSDDMQFKRGQLSEKHRHLGWEEGRLAALMTELREMKAQTNQHQHQHPDAVAEAATDIEHMHRHPAEQLMARLEQRRAKAEWLSEKLHASIQTTKTEIRDLERGIASSALKLDSITRQLESLNQRETARQQRERNRRDSAPFNNKALSAENAKTLNDDIKLACNLIDRHCQDKKQDTADRCYLAFITQLNKHVDGLALQPSEKIALSQLIATMQQHLRDLTACQEQQSLLNTYVNTLQSEEQLYATNGVRYRALQTEHADLINTNDRLSAELRILQGQQQTLETQRNEYAKYALKATIAAGLGAIAGYFLIHTSVLMVAPIVPVVLAGVVGTAVVTLLAIAGVAGIRALLRQSEASTMENTVSENTARMGQITIDLDRLGDAAPQLLDSIAHHKILIENQRLMVTAAQSTADASLTYAQGITIASANLEMENTPSNHRDRFFSTQPSAPCAPLIRDDFSRHPTRDLFGGSAH